MLENNRDEINYHKFLKSVRQSQGVSLERTAFGVCTKSGMSRIESGNRLPGKLVRDRLTARLGISGEEYEEYLLPKEFKQWQLRRDIISCINKRNTATAEKKIKQYAEKYAINDVERQFVEAMRFLVYEQKGFSREILCTQIYRAMICTVPDMAAAFAGAQILADQELNLMMEYIRLCTPAMSEKKSAEWKLENYHKIYEYVENASWDKIAQAKVYSRLAYLVAELVLEKYSTEESLYYALELCNQGIELLRDTIRLYYFIELNEYRVKLIERICSQNKENENFESAELENLRETSMEWATVFHELYEENGLPTYMENFSYLYAETECNNIRDVIYIRRKMMKMSRQKLCCNVCDERTLIRLELGQVNPTMAIVRDLFDKLGLCAEYKRARIVSSSAGAMRRYFELLKEVNKGSYQKAYQIYHQLCKEIDMDVIFNEQEMKRMETLIFRGLGKLSKKEHYELLIDVMECTMGIDNLVMSEKKYLSANELLCAHNFLTYTEGDIVRKLEKYCEGICNDLLQLEEFESSCVTRYEMLMYQYASSIGNCGNYAKSGEISRKLLKESLRNWRMLYVTNCEYNEVWNYQSKMERNHLPVDKTYIHKSLQRCLTLSIISKKENWQKFFQQKLEVFVADI